MQTAATTDALQLADEISTWLREHFQQSGAARYVLGLSGGIDSAVVAGLAARGHAAEDVEDQAADRVDVLLMLAGLEGIADHRSDIRYLGLAVDQIDAGGGPGDQRFGGVVMLVLDVADDHLDNVLQRGQPVGATIFVDHQRHLDARRLHARHQVGGQHGGRHEQHRAHEAQLADGAREIHLAEVQRVGGGSLGAARPLLA